LARYLRHVEAPVDDASRLLLSSARGYDLLLRGKSRAAAAEFQSAQDLLSSDPALFDPVLDYTFRSYLAISYLRAGEQENCIDHHTGESCLLPIQGSGVHVRPDGVARAAVELERFLTRCPSDLSSRWLLNVAHMALGDYPDGVREAWRIPPGAFAAEGPMQPFADVASALDIAASGLVGGCVVDDFDGDGYLDVMASSFGLVAPRDQLRLYHNQGDGSFVDRSVAAGLEGLVGGSNLVQADFDNDGYLDVLVLRGAGLIDRVSWQPPSLLRNRGDGTFEDVTEAAGLLFRCPSQAAAWGDFDNDGWLDLFVGIESSVVPAFELPLFHDLEPSPKVPCKLFRNNRNGSFTDVAADAGVAGIGYIKGAAFGDYDNDGRPDLVVTQLFGPAILLHNEGGHFAQAGVLEPNRSYAVWFWDYDNDGWLDLFVGSNSQLSPAYVAGQIAADYLGLPVTVERPRLYHNRGDGTFVNVTDGSGLGRALYATGAAPGDFDNDGRPDVYFGTGAADYRALIPNRMFRNAGDGRFQDVTTAARVGHLQKASGVALGDVDNDGDQDIYVVVGGEYPGDTFRNALFLNSGTENHWLTLRLEGRGSNRSAIGARIDVRLDTDEGPDRVCAVVSSGGSLGASSLQQELGLGKAKAIRSVEVHWPTTGKTQRFANIPLDCIVAIREGAEPEVLTPRKVEIVPPAPDRAFGGSCCSPMDHATPTETR